MKIHINLSKQAFPLNQMKSGELVAIQSYRSPSPGSGRLKELGMISGAIVRVKRKASALYPLEIALRGYDLLISDEDAQEILVTRMLH